VGVTVYGRAFDDRAIDGRFPAPASACRAHVRSLRSIRPLRSAWFPVRRLHPIAMSTTRISSPSTICNW
jgi:hypothetical protein